MLLELEIGGSSVVPSGQKDVRWTAMEKYPYTVWFDDPALPVDDQDKEWCACFFIEAGSAEEAKHWGDLIAAAYVSEFGRLRVIRSNVDNSAAWLGLNNDATPTIRIGHLPSRNEIGW